MIMNENIKNIVNEYSKLIVIKPTSADELKDLALKIQNLAQILKNYFKEDVYELLKITDFIQHYDEIIKEISDDKINSFIKNIKKKNYSPEDIVTILDPSLTEEIKLLAMILCSDTESYLKLNTYLASQD